MENDAGQPKAESAARQKRKGRLSNGLLRHRIFDAADKLHAVHSGVDYGGYRAMYVRVAIISGLALAIVALAVYATVLYHRLDSARVAAAEQTERAAQAELRAEELQRAASALREAQEHADRTRQAIERTHADTLWRVDDIIDSGALDERVCKLANEAYTELVCSPDSYPVRPSATAGTP